MQNSTNLKRKLNCQHSAEKVQHLMKKVCWGEILSLKKPSALMPGFFSAKHINRNVPA